MSRIDGACATGGVPGYGGEGESVPEQCGDNAPKLPDSEMYGMGLEMVAAALASKSAETTLKVAREGARAAKLEQAAELKAQADAMRAKADAMRTQAYVSGGMSIAGGGLSIAGGAVHGDKAQGSTLSRVLSPSGTMTSSLSQPAGTLGGGRAAQNLDADANVHASAAKTAEGVAEEFGTLERQARSVIEKATSVMQSLVAERQAVARAILRAG